MKRSICISILILMILAGCTGKKELSPAPVIILDDTEFETTPGTVVQISPEYENADDATFTWTLGTSTIGTDPTLSFSSQNPGSYIITLTVTNEGGSDNITVTVTVEDEPNEEGEEACNEVFDFTPAPGQFINSGYDAATMEEACAYAKERLSQEAYVSLGAYGGYIVVGFDHSIKNDGGYNIAVKGNSFDGSSEPGIVWVMQDENKDGFPNDTWYELKGSEYGKEGTIENYAVTYFRPSGNSMPVQWSDNLGQSGEVEYLGAYHSQNSYYPEWIAADSLILTGTRLESKSYDKSGNGTYWVNPAFDWGYADNYSPTDHLSDGNNVFRISDAVTADGKDAELNYVDFVKVQTGVNAQCGWIGEVSTEVCGIYDYNIIKNE
ncbi:MAG: PKD domain-containing protein [Bacteroidales bacterium]|nr:PKD domain-containing protein [Bacteroidales bacterium]MCI2121816.1 PKD domain-containing protein [Bacteroidales bacterium]MCI2146047.1 PKD domain-containing protein [Bacteroidales bacterium]